MKMIGGVELKLHVFLTSVVNSGELHGWIISRKVPLARNEGQIDLRAELDGLEVRLMDISLTFAGNQTTIPHDDGIVIC
jgi:hypothetical protein